MRGSKGGGPDPISPSENSNFLKLHSKITLDTSPLHKANVDITRPGGGGGGLDTRISNCTVYKTYIWILVVINFMTTLLEYLFTIMYNTFQHCP